jgi:protoporphyrinogen oxidase
MTIALVVEGQDLFPDNWIYIHDPGVRVGRIQNFRSWSPWMVPDPNMASVGMEYFCNAGDDLWTARDEDLVEMAKRELGQLQLGDPAKVRRGTVVRVPMAYPMYDWNYAQHVETIKGWLAGIGNLQQVGRNGLHRYNNSDHSMLTAMRAVDNLLLGTDHDLWAVNADSVYHEEDDRPGDPNPYPYRDDRVTPAPAAS